MAYYIMSAGGDAPRRAGDRSDPGGGRSRRGTLNMIILIMIMMVIMIMITMMIMIIIMMIIIMTIIIMMIIAFDILCCFFIF